MKNLVLATVFALALSTPALAGNTSNSSSKLQRRPHRPRPRLVPWRSRAVEPVVLVEAPT
jgi:hypothetical protein